MITSCMVYIKWNLIKMKIYLNYVWYTLLTSIHNKCNLLTLTFVHNKDDFNSSFRKASPASSLKLSEFPHGAVHPTYHSQNFWSPYQFLCKQRIYLDTVLLLKTENWKYCNKIIFKCVNSNTRPIFYLNFVKKRGL